MRKLLTLRGMIPVVMCVQVVPLLIFPPNAYSMDSQEWWLPALLTFLVIISLVQILIRRSQATWPWRLVSFAQGLNIISRIMMLLSHTTVNHEGTQVFNTAYFLVSVVAMVLSALEIWYAELPEVKRRLLTA